MLNLPTPDDARRLREFFLEQNYTDEALRAALAGDYIPYERLVPRLLARTAEPRSLLNILARWFIVGEPVDSAAARALVPEPILRLLLGSGLVAPAGERLAPQAMLVPFHGLLLATDCVRKVEARQQPDPILSINPTTVWLYLFTLRRPFHATLDLGTGCGIQALGAAAHSERVVATDVNPRAAEFVAFNARLNGVQNLEYLAGDLFQPVASRRFDLIISNPPFFITPSSQLQFAENPLELDEFARRLVTEGAQHLEEGGFLQILCEWVEVRGESWQERLRTWFAGIGCDAWALKTYTNDPVRYTELRLPEMVPASERNEAQFRRWVDYYRSRGVEAIHDGLIMLRRRSGSNWVRTDEARTLPNEPFGDAVLGLFASEDLLRSASGDAALRAARFKLSPHARLTRHSSYADGQWQTTPLELWLKTGLVAAAPLALEPAVEQFVRQFDGRRTLDELIAHLAAEVHARPERVREECLRVTRKLLERGFLLVA
ncbi:MAG TPA: methyltransferase [Terriglobia bacterium]|nr:methyltransferase [Terriglobia bacterium]